jgi:hypothetical protein
MGKKKYAEIIASKEELLKNGILLLHPGQLVVVEAKSEDYSLIYKVVAEIISFQVSRIYIINNKFLTKTTILKYIKKHKEEQLEFLPLQMGIKVNSMNKEILTVDDNTITIKKMLVRLIKKGVFIFFCQIGLFTSDWIGSFVVNG